MTRPTDWRRAPSSTYRLQLHAGFTCADAAHLAPYLRRLGIGACYSSPILTARPGSPHGYDIVNHHEINPEIGGTAGFDALVAALRASELQLVVDFVPNHMAADATSNPWWRDVLENGSCSHHARTFDIDWEPLKEQIRHKLLLPILGDQYGLVLERGELQLDYANGSFELRYFEHRLPVNPRPAAAVLRHDLDVLQVEMGATDPAVLELLSIATGLDHLPPFTSTDPDLIEERQREKVVLRERLGRLTDASPAMRAHLARAVTAFNGVAGDPDSFTPLHELLEAQAYRLAYWRVAGHEINYRRFFDINDLAGLRMERPAVFADTHQLLADLVRHGAVQGIRVDHPDGLFDPEEYFGRLAGLVPERTPYVVAEKILSANEGLPANWAVDGTTGYDFLNDVGGVFVNAAAVRPMRRTHARVSGSRDRLDDVVYASKLLIMDTSLASELNVLADSLDRLSEADRRSRDFTLNSLRDLLAETVACFPIYRTYLSPRGATDHDREAIDRALGDARRRNPAMDGSIFDFLRNVLLPEGDPPPGSLELAMKLQQFTAPVQAKGLEDTAFYRYNVLISLNEVGGEPGRFGRTVPEFHAANAARAADWPLGMLATSTHDTKLGEDARMRVHTLAELPAEWSEAVGRWQRLTAGSRRQVHGAWAPDGNDVYRLYQVLVACWPPGPRAPGPMPDVFVSRIQGYMIKATREAKRHTSWVNENREYESAVEHFIARILSGAASARFLGSFEPFARRVAALGAVYSLGQLVLKIASPGVPDIYQGCESWALTLVDPDNRSPVDFESLGQSLDALEPLLEGIDEAHPARRHPALAAEVHGLADAWPDGRVKLYVTAAGLRLRRRHPDLFLAGRYVPVDVDAPGPSGAVAFVRQLDDRAVLALAPRLVAGASGPEPGPSAPCSWQGARVRLPDELAPRTWLNVLTGARHRPRQDADGTWLDLDDLMQTFPVVLAWAES